MSALGQDRDLRRQAAEQERERIRQTYPTEFNDGAKRAFEGSALYPPGFHGWPLDRRNAWFAGFNFGYHYRKRESGNG